MSIYIRNDVEENGRDYLVEKYVNGLERDGLKGEFDNWMDYFIFSCVLKAVDEQKKKFVDLEEVYEVNVKPMSMKIEMEFGRSDYYSALDRLESRGQLETNYKKEDTVYYDNDIGGAEYNKVSVDAYMKAVDAMTRSGLATVDENLFKMKKNVFGMMDDMTRIMEGRVGDVIDKSAASQFPVIDAEETFESIIDGYMELNGSAVDEKILAGFLGYAANWSLNKMHKMYRDGNLNDGNGADMTGPLMQMETYAMISRFSMSRKPGCIEPNTVREKMGDILKELDGIEAIGTNIDSGQIMFFLAKQYEDVRRQKKNETKFA